MLGETQKPILPHPRSAVHMRARKKQFPISISNWMKQTHFPLGAGAIAASILLTPGMTRAVPVTWNVDSSASYVELTVPDQAIYVTNIGNVTISLRDASNNSQWTDAGGRRAAVGGTILTDYADATSITFPSNAPNLYALEQTNLRPNPADWNPATTNYSGTSTAPAAFGARARATYVLIIFPITADAAFLALRNVQFNIVSGVVPVVGGVLATNQTQFGISSATGDVDGLDIASLGQPVPDVLAAALPPIVQTNTAGGTIQNLGGQARKLTYTISMTIVMEAEGMTLTGSAAGQIVAYGTIPRPTLRIAPAGQQTVLIAWPTNATGFVLQQNALLGTTNWVTVTNTPAIVGSEKQVFLPAAARSFYRLRSP